MSWSAAQYVNFEAERTRPVRDLLAAVPNTDVRRAIDLGCGPGNSTEVLAARYPGAAITGLDNSADMIAAARKRMPDMRFDLVDLQSWAPAETYDVILSNAVLQWVPDHEALMPALLDRLAPGGSLAVQMPDNLEEPAHRLMREVAALPRFAAKLAGAAGSRTPRRGADWYYRLLKPHAGRVDVWLTVYHHVLPGGADAVIEWFKGSGLRPFLAPLDPAETDDYLAEYRTGIAREYPTLPDGSVLLPFPRLFIVATR
ncbi:trans-aconitate 2-methyltransferase [Rhodopila sp.]|jgi:trans-aconitate 2-methyltransferase|uniref:trans-aconitate 2-methyltransferase n=1 Tax=Rhodopila sp. TaxID=2480087 RepID=UPI002CD79AFC|nr:trans-aconitate 2-methyltransferase [Rhodopila sp.]HVZ10245.1 trans-aconitate 2-methyltransferase [Rhodopila sp.]